MARLKSGARMPNFRYDTPYVPGNNFEDLLKNGPLFVVFLSNLGHPVTRAVLERYAATASALEECGLVCVVRSRPEVIAAALPEGSLPFPLICDAEGTLYEHFEIPQEKNALRYGSLQAIRILKAAQKQGYRLQKDAPQQLPLTLLLGEKREILFAHYGRSLTDLPEDCAAMQRILQKWDDAAEKTAIAEERRLEKAQAKRERVIAGYTGHDDSAGEKTVREAPAEDPRGQEDPFAAVLEKMKQDMSEPTPQPAPKSTALPPKAATPSGEPVYHEKSSDILDDEGKAFTIASFFGGE